MYQNTVKDPSEYNSDTLQMYQMQKQMSHNMIQDTETVGMYQNT